MKQAILTLQQKEAFKNYFLVTENGMVPIGNSDEVTKESFKALWLNESHILQEVTADDFEWYDPDEGDKDFVLISSGECIVLRNEIPKEICQILDAAIEARKK